MLRLLILIAMLIAPLGMAPAAAKQTVTSAAPMQHCPEQAPNHSGKAGFGECAMACSAALPATELARESPRSIVCVPAETAVAQHLHGVHPEIATPPPRRG